MTVVRADTNIDPMNSNNSPTILIKYRITSMSYKNSTRISKN